MDDKLLESNKTPLVNGRVRHSTTPPDSTSSIMDLSSGYLKGIHDVYTRRILSIENNVTLSESQKYTKKIIALESYVKHLYEQNDCFASTMVNLERECDQRVKEMEKRLKKSAKNTMEAVINMHEFEKETKRLVEERMYIESLYKEVKQNLTALKVENGFLRDQNSGLNHDVQALLQVIQKARSDGNWELDCITFCEVTPEQVFGPIQSISKADTSSYFFSQDNRKGKTNFSPVHLHSSYLPRCASLPEIGNIYNFSQAVHKSNSCDTNKGFLGVKLSSKHKRIGAENTTQTPELLKDVSCVKNLEEKLCNRKSQSEPHLFMFDGNIYKYTPCEPIQKPSSNVLNENYQSSLPPYQSIDLKFPTEGSTLKIHVWNKLKSGSYLDDQENLYLKDNSLDTSPTYSELDLEGLNFRMHRILQENSSDHSTQVSRFSIGLQAETDRTSVGTQAISSEFEESELTDELLHKKKVITEQKSILLSELQNHLNSAFQEIEEKNEAIKSMEKKLQLSQDECISLGKQVDTLTDLVEAVNNENKESSAEIESLKTQMKQQASLIMSLQEALVQSKRALDAAQPKASSMKMPENQKVRKSPRSNIIDI